MNELFDEILKRMTSVVEQGHKTFGSWPRCEKGTSVLTLVKIGQGAIGINNKIFKLSFSIWNID